MDNAYMPMSSSVSSSDLIAWGTSVFCTSVHVLHLGWEKINLMIPPVQQWWLSLSTVPIAAYVAYTVRITYRISQYVHHFFLQDTLHVHTTSHIHYTQWSGALLYLVWASQVQGSLQLSYRREAYSFLTEAYNFLTERKPTAFLQKGSLQLSYRRESYNFLTEAKFPKFKETYNFFL